MTWQQFAADAPQFAVEIRRQFTASRHHVLATLRRDGSPRVSAVELHWSDDQLELWSMPGSRKALDLRADGRFAVHARPGATSAADPDVKLSGVATEVTDPGERRRWIERAAPASTESHLFRVDLTEVVTTAVDGDHLLIKLWRPARGVVAFRRY
ncbi:pyridoxamine 5'-phosphate oxidase family protein [Saccharopolyspora taberi]